MVLWDSGMSGVKENNSSFSLCSQASTLISDQRLNIMTVRKLGEISELQGGPKMAQFLLNPLTLSNIKRFSKFFHCQNQKKNCDKIISKDPTTPHVCRYTTL